MPRSAEIQPLFWRFVNTNLLPAKVQAWGTRRNAIRRPTASVLVTHAQTQREYAQTQPHSRCFCAQVTSRGTLHKSIHSPTASVPTHIATLKVRQENRETAPSPRMGDAPRRASNRARMHLVSTDTRKSTDNPRKSKHGERFRRSTVELP